MAQMTTEGFFCGGPCPYGYQLIKNGQKNNRGYELHDLMVQPDEAAVIQKIFDCRIHCGYGSRKIASALEEQVITNRNGEKFHYSSIRGILEREQYTGVFIRGDSRSDALPGLMIISAETFAASQRITQLRKGQQLSQKMTGQALLSKEWAQAEFPIQKMMLSQIIERVEVLGNTDIRVIFREILPL